MQASLLKSAKLVMVNARIAHTFFGCFAVRMHFFPDIK